MRSSKDKIFRVYRKESHTRGLIERQNVQGIQLKELHQNIELSAAMGAHLEGLVRHVRLPGRVEGPRH